MLKHLFGLSLSIIALLLTAASAQTAPPVIAAASDLKFALEEIAARFKAKTGNEVRMTFGSSGNFTSQLLQGAPFEIFLSADEGFVFQLADAGKTIDRGALYAEGRIVLFAPKGSPLAGCARPITVAAAPPGAPPRHALSAATPCSVIKRRYRRRPR